MLRLTRSDDAPDVLMRDSARRRAAERTIASMVESGELPSSRDFAALWREPAVRNALWNMQKGRCCYCESLREPKRESDIEHFRPKTEITEECPSRPGYWWLAYEWSNLFFACKICNEEYKRTHFPIRGTRATGPGDELGAEDATLLNPSCDDLDDAIDFDWDTLEKNVFIFGVGGDAERVRTTVKIIGLNRPLLARQRWDALVPLRIIADSVIEARRDGLSAANIQKAASVIRRVTARRSAAPFIGMKRRFFRARGLGAYVATD